MIYTDDNRGIIQNRNRKKQIINFSGLRYRNITPTDCDGLIEYQDKAYVIFEIKYKNIIVPEGQSLAFVRMCNDFYQAEKPAIFIIAEHEVYDTNCDIDAAACRVRTFYFNHKWYDEPTTLKSLIDRFIAFVDRRAL